jgi:hypothetical protein
MKHFSGEKEKYQDSRSFSKTSFGRSEFSLIWKTRGIRTLDKIAYEKLRRVTSLGELSPSWRFSNLGDFFIALAAKMIVYHFFTTHDKICS